MLTTGEGECMLQTDGGTVTFKEHQQQYEPHDSIQEEIGSNDEQYQPCN